MGDRLPPASIPKVSHVIMRMIKCGNAGQKLVGVRNLIPPSMHYTLLLHYDFHSFFPHGYIPYNSGLRNLLQDGRKPIRLST